MEQTKTGSWARCCKETQFVYSHITDYLLTVGDEQTIRYKLADGRPVSFAVFCEVYGLGKSRWACSWCVYLFVVILSLCRMAELATRALDPLINQPSTPKVPSLPRGLRMSRTEIYMAVYLVSPRTEIYIIHNSNLCRMDDCQESYVSFYADEQPDRVAKHLVNIYLPCLWKLMWVLSFQDPTKFGELWTAYQFHCKTRGKETVVGSETLFNLVWRKRFLYTKVVAIRRNKGIISLCVFLWFSASLFYWRGSWRLVHRLCGDKIYGGQRQVSSLNAWFPGL